MSQKKYFQINKMARIITLCSVVVALATSGILISYYSSNIITPAMNTEKISLAGEAAATTTSNSSTTTTPTRKEYTLIAQDAELEIAPGKVVKTWTFNGTMPAPPLRFTEGDNVTIKFINKTPIPHTIHFHGYHDDLNDGVHPQIMPNETYLYNITAAPAGALMYHCHAHPTSLHIRMGMYGALIVDPKNTPLPPAREFVMVMSEFDDDNLMKFETEYYPINGYLDQYVHNPLTINQDELLRLYVINLGTTIPYHFHLHSTTAKAYPSGLLSNEQIDVQTIAVGPGDATIIEAQWEYPGTYLFHSHGFQEERGNMGQIVVAGGEGGDSNTNNINNQTIAGNEARSTSMFDWQYELQKKLQNPKIVNYTDAQLGGFPSNNNSNSDRVAHDNITTFTHPTANASGAPIPEHSLPDEGPEEGNNNDNNNNSGAIPSNLEISIVQGSSSLTDTAYQPNPVQVSVGTTVTWTNDDSQPHTVTSGENSTPDGRFDSSPNFNPLMAPAATFSHTFTEAGEYPYYCALHPNMVGTVNVS